MKESDGRLCLAGIAQVPESSVRFKEFPKLFTSAGRKIRGRDV